MQVSFDQDGCFIEKEGRIIARGRREGRMFIPDLHKMKSSMFTKSTKADSDIKLWHKRIGHINLNNLKAMQSKGVIIELPTFKEKDIEGVCEACQLGKQHRHPFSKKRNVRKGLLDVVHSDVWGPTNSYIRQMPILRCREENRPEAETDRKLICFAILAHNRDVGSSTENRNE